jgi:hypothetical protein
VAVIGSVNWMRKMVKSCCLGSGVLSVLGFRGLDSSLSSCDMVVKGEEYLEIKIR